MQTKNIFSSMTIITTLIMIGCTNDNQPKDTRLTSDENLVDTIDERSVKTYIKKNREHQVRSIFSSGDKLTYSSQILKKGDVVFNQTMGQKGVITGSIIVTLLGNSIPMDLSKKFKLSKLTQNNYKLLAEKNSDIEELVTYLNSHDQISNVEISVNYSPINTQF